MRQIAAPSCSMQQGLGSGHVVSAQVEPAPCGVPRFLRHALGVSVVHVPCAQQACDSEDPPQEASEQEGAVNISPSADSHWDGVISAHWEPKGVEMQQGTVPPCWLQSACWHDSPGWNVPSIWSQERFWT
jgi:hypothetical protein